MRTAVVVVGGMALCRRHGANRLPPTPRRSSSPARRPPGGWKGCGGASSGSRRWSSPPRARSLSRSCHDRLGNDGRRQQAGTRRVDGAERNGTEVAGSTLDVVAMRAVMLMAAIWLLFGTGPGNPTRVRAGRRRVEHQTLVRPWELPNRHTDPAYGISCVQRPRVAAIATGGQRPLTPLRCRCTRPRAIGRAGPRRRAASAPKRPSPAGCDDPPPHRFLTARSGDPR